MPVGLKLAIHGPLFMLGARPIVEAVENTVKDIVGEGERDVKKQLYFGHGVLTGHYKRSIHGEVKDSMHGLIHDSRVVYGQWLEGVSSRNERSRFKGYFMFRNAYQRLKRRAQEWLDIHMGRAMGALK